MIKWKDGPVKSCYQWTVLKFLNVEDREPHPAGQYRTVRFYRNRGSPEFSPAYRREGFVVYLFGTQVMKRQQQERCCQPIWGNRYCRSEACVTLHKCNQISGMTGGSLKWNVLSFTPPPALNVSIESQNVWTSEKKMVSRCSSQLNIYGRWEIR